jgi:anti-sigma factor RsiW
MSCREAQQEIPLYCYGESAPEAEERLEAHLAECSECRAELERYRNFLELVDARQNAADSAGAGLLASCRADLRSRINAEAAKPRSAFERWFDISRLHIPVRIPVGAMALFALGWFAARHVPTQFGGVTASVADPMFSSVRSVEPPTQARYTSRWITFAAR